METDPPSPFDLDTDDNESIANQFTVTLVRPKEGDCSLGLELFVMGSKAIVKRLLPLKDGTPSPAQTTAVSLKRGDVILSVNQKSLVHQPIETLMEHLRPFNTSSCLQLELKVEEGSGLKVLDRYEQMEQKRQNQNFR